MRKIALVITLLFAMFVVWEGVALSNQIYIPVVYSPGPTPTNTPPANPPGVQILPNSSHFIDGDGYLHINGEVLNNTGDDLDSVKITANFFNSSHQRVWIDDSYIYLTYLPAFDKACFDFYLPNPSGWTYYEFDEPEYSSYGYPLPNLTILNKWSYYDSSHGWYVIFGQVRNDEDSHVTMATLVGTLYKDTGTVVGCYFADVSDDDLAPAETGSFEMYFSDRNYSDVYSYRLQVDGNLQQP